MPLWTFPVETLDCHPVTDSEDKRQLDQLRTRLVNAGDQFNSLVKNKLASYFPHESGDNSERYWGNSLLTVTFFRDDETYYLMVDNYDSEATVNFALFFNKPERWSDPVKFEPAVATGYPDEIANLIRLFISEWPNCVPLTDHED